MSSLSEIFERENAGFIAKRFLFCLVIVLVYVFLWRPVRVAVTKHLVYPPVKHIDSTGDSFVASFNNGALFIEYSYGDISKELKYRPQFGFFFLVALMALLFVSSTPRHYYLLVGIHLVATLLAYVLLMTGVLGIQAGFVLTDAVAGYLTPALSLAIVPLVMTGMIE